MPAELQLLVIVIALFGFWAIVMRPTRVQQRRVADLQADLEIGDEVIISAGIFGTVVAIEDERVRLQIAPDTVITVARQVVIRRAPEPDEAAPEGADHPGAAPQDSKTEED
ncbi:MAG TPA: preprotein translocase subunit YajC [Marmoricola sp.]|nr:preprotein translocase subunit YajC [Marmoricola sp.]